MLQQVPLNAISAMLGHSSIKTTEIYLKSLPSHILVNIMRGWCSHRNIFH
jgi:integrase/recombinase XerD